MYENPTDDLRLSRLRWWNIVVGLILAAQAVADAEEKLQAKLLVRHLASTEAQGHFHLVALVEEAACRLHLGVVRIL